MEKNDTSEKSVDLVVGPDGLARPAWATEGMMQAYYDTEWGMPVHDERSMFERLSLEAFQTGLSWATILRKRDALRAAFDNFDPDVVAGYGNANVERLMSNKEIIRHSAKIFATIKNAMATINLRKDGGLVDFVWSFKPTSTPEPQKFSDIPTSSRESTALSVALRARGFKFVGPTNMFALMEAIGIVDTHLVGSHRRGSSGVWVVEKSKQRQAKR
jgi:DNA-3-methyladenine glycosylase I